MSDSLDLGKKRCNRFNHLAPFTPGKTRQIASFAAKTHRFIVNFSQRSHDSNQRHTTRDGSLSPNLTGPRR
jgi:hypothetical protein